MKEPKGWTKHNIQKLKEYLEENKGKFSIRKLLARFCLQEGFKAKTVKKYYDYLLKTKEPQNEL